jgi:hypothetical protein
VLVPILLTGAGKRTYSPILLAVRMEGQRALQALGGEQRNALAAQGATLLLLDVPLGTTIAIDFTRSVTTRGSDVFSSVALYLGASDTRQRCL